MNELKLSYHIMMVSMNRKGLISQFKSVRFLACLIYVI